MIKVTGHISPDTDATVAPYVYAWFLKTIKSENAEAFKTGELNRETQFVFGRFEVPEPSILANFNEGDKYILIDTNNPEEILPGFENAELVELIDHHKLVGGLSTTAPIDITIKTVASSSTIIWSKIKSEVEQMPSDMAGLLLSGILSDTLKFTSPTTTNEDRLAAEELSKIADVDIDQLADEMFEAKSDLTGMNARDLILMDSKVYMLGNTKARVAVLETVKPQNAFDMLAEIKETIEDIKEEEKLDSLFFFIVDIMNSTAHLIVVGDEDKVAAQKAFEKEFSGDVLELPGVVSRKKQIIPNLEKALS